MSRATKIALMAVGNDSWQGGIQYISNIMNALNEIGKEQPIEIHLFRHAAQKFNDVSRLTNLSIVEHNTEEIFESWTFLNRLKWFLQRKVNSRINPRMENYLLALKPDFVFPATLSDCNEKLNSGAWIADFQYYHFPNGAQKIFVEDAERVISEIAAKAKKVVLSSKACEDDCVKLFPITKGKTFVMPFAVGINRSELEFTNFDEIKSLYNLPDKFLMVANLFAPTKNHKTLFEAMGLLKKRGIEINLLCTGNIVDYRNNGFANEILQMLTQYQIRTQVHLLGLIPRAHQLTLFRMAVAMVQPSVNEGWSTSVEEAKILGKDILLSDIDVHLEQYPNNPYVFEALNAEDLANKIEKVWVNANGRKFPDMEREKNAFNKYQENVKTFGRRFLEIAAL